MYAAKEYNVASKISLDHVPRQGTILNQKHTTKICLSSLPNAKAACKVSKSVRHVYEMK